jgi:hypothetical protein
MAKSLQYPLNRIHGPVMDRESGANEPDAFETDPNCVAAAHADGRGDPVKRTLPSTPTDREKSPGSDLRKCLTRYESKWSEASFVECFRTKLPPYLSN